MGKYSFPPNSPCNLHPLGLHPEAIAFFDLKSRNNDCDSPTLGQDLMKAPLVRKQVRKRALKLLETKFIKDAWFANTHYQTRLLSHGRSQTLQALTQHPNQYTEVRLRL